MAKHRVYSFCPNYINTVVLKMQFKYLPHYKTDKTTSKLKCVSYLTANCNMTLKLCKNQKSTKNVLSNFLMRSAML